MKKNSRSYTLLPALGRNLLAFLLIVGIDVIPILAQSNTGRVVGTVIDSQGGVMPGVSVTLVDNQTKKERTLVTDDAGNFVVPQLETGSYAVTATQPGFKTYTVNDVVIEIGREYTLKIIMQVGVVDTVVQVTAGAALVNMTTGEVSTTITTRQIMDLPLNGRNPLQLMQMQAGSASNPSQNTSINGMRTATTNITHDGINIQDAFIRSNATDFAPGRPTVDDTAEFTMVNQNATADQGYGGAQIRLVTPRGTSQYHASTYWFNRNSEIAANSFFNNRSGIVRPFRNRNQIGGNFNGPVPMTKDKVFFFANYEALRDIIKSNQSRTILLPDARKGVFTYRDSANAVRTIDLFTMVPGITAIDPTVNSRLLSKLPTVGNATDIGDGLNTTGYRFSQANNSNRDQYTIRGDYDLSVHNNFNAVWAWNKEVNLRPDVDGTQGFGDHPVINQSSVNKRLVGAWRWTPQARFTNEVRGGFFNSDVPFYRLQDPGAYWITPGVFSNPEVTFMNQGRTVHTYNMQDNAEWQKGQHSLRFGAVLQWFQVDPNNYAGIVPTYTLGTNVNTPTLSAAMFPGGISTTQLSTANSLFATLGGIVSAGQQSFNVPNKSAKTFTATPRLEDYRYENYSWYFSDQWRLRPNLTLNLGIRYELWPSVRLLNGLLLEPVIPAGKSAYDTVMSPTGTYNYIGANAGKENTIHKIDKNNIAPVISAAWTPRAEGFMGKILGENKSVFRGGFRVSYLNDSILTSVRNAAIGNAGLSTTTVGAINPATGNTALNARLNALPSVVAPAVQIPRTYADNNTAAFSNFGTVFLVDPNLQIPRTLEYNVSYQRELPWNMAMEARYVGNSSNNLNRSIDYNQVDIRDNGFAADFNRARRNLLANGNANVGETLTVFPLLTNGGSLTNTTNRNYLINGVPADMAINYVQLAQSGTVKFLPNPGTGVANLFTNGAEYNYNSLQLDLRKRFSNGLFFMTNYSFQKVLSNGIGTSQTMVEPFLDNKNPQLEYTRADYDQTHVLNFSNIYELPIGRKKAYFADTNPVVAHIISGWTINSIVRMGSGAPITITDARGTLNRAARAGRQTPNSPLPASALKGLVGWYETSRGIYALNPVVTNQATGRAAEGYGTTPFINQAFFNVDPGATGGMARAIFNGPWTYNIDFSILKNFQITERVKYQFRLEAFNLLNQVCLNIGQTQDINSTSFGRSTSTATGARVVQFGMRLEF